MKKKLLKKRKRILPKAFTKFLIDQQPSYDDMIIRDIHPMDTWIQPWTERVQPVTTLRDRIQSLQTALKIAQFQWAAYQYCSAFRDKKRRATMLKRLMGAYKKLHSI